MAFAGATASSAGKIAASAGAQACAQAFIFAALLSVIPPMQSPQSWCCAMPSAISAIGMIMPTAQAAERLPEAASARPSSAVRTKR